MDDKTGRVTPPRAEDETDIRTQEIREEIAQTRMEMSDTIEAIEERLRPSNLVARAGETVRNATTEKVKSMANTAGQAADRVIDTSFARTIKEHPIPAAMIGIGAAWLLMTRRSHTRRDDETRGYGGYRASGAYGSAERDWRVGAAGVSGSDVAIGTSGYGESGYQESGYGAYGSGASGEAGHVPEFGGEIRPYYSERRRSVNFERVVRENPLVVGAAAALIGAAIGMSLPASEAENRLMGEARDNVVDRARETASEAAEKVQDVAGRTPTTGLG